MTFSDGGSGMRWYDDPLAEGRELAEAGHRYRVAHVDQPSFPGGLGRAWCDLVAE